MYPATYHENSMRYEAGNEVFVAMSFSASFQRAFERVLEPAIRSVKIGDTPLSALVINRGTSGAPDIHERTFDAVIHSRLVVADMTVQSSYVGDDGKPRWQADANVAYEVGLACTWRNPEDILLVHQPHPEHAYSFDVQNLRHVSYDPDDASGIPLIAGEIARALNQSSFLAKQTYQKVLQSASPSAIQLMHQEARRAFPVISLPDQDRHRGGRVVRPRHRVLSAGGLLAERRTQLRGARVVRCASRGKHVSASS